MSQTNIKSYIFAIISCFCWATMAPVSKILFSGLTNMAVLGYGSAIGAVALFIILRITGQVKELRALSIKETGKRLALGILGYFIYSALYYKGIDVLSAQTACILNYLWPLFTVLFSIPILGEKLSISKVGALLLSFGGVCVIVLGGGSAQTGSGNMALGYFACILAAVCYGLFNNLNKRIDGSELVNMFLYIGIGAILALLTHLSEGLVIPTGGEWLGLIWLGIFADGIAYLCWALALNSGDTTTISNIAFSTPIMSVFLSALMLGEHIQISSIAGLGLILGGIIMQTVLDKKK